MCKLDMKKKIVCLTLLVGSANFYLFASHGIEYNFISHDNTCYDICINDTHEHNIFVVAAVIMQEIIMQTKIALRVG